MIAATCWLWFVRGGRRNADGTYDEDDDANVRAFVGALLMNDRG